MPLGRAMIPKRRKPGWAETDHYYEADLTPAERDVVLVALRSLNASSVDSLRLSALQKLSTARRIPLKLEDRGQGLDWPGLEAEAERRGTTVLEAWFDLIGRRGPG